ncbi:transcription initiation factor IIB family protein [Salinigranum marinum]|uniref:transcription initiation factor IIB n=1 Tax=Salinigranum marinum TaxID=1515595 RepID=UPI002989E6E6|nr:transcription initiation factor IIB family protein [Salinigranum marinum]
MSTVTQTGCPECDGRLNTDASETVCAECGLVVSADHIDHGPEWRSFPDGPSRERTGAPLTRSRHDRGLSTEIGRSTRVKGRKRRQLARMRVQHNRAQISTKRERNQVYVFTEIRSVTAGLSLPTHICEMASTLFRSAQSADIVRRRSLEGFAAAVYAACRVQGVSRTIEEVVAEARADRGELRAAYDALNRELGLPTGPIDPAEYIPRYATRLGVDAETERRAREYAVSCTETGVASGRNPSGVAAACLYTASCDLGGDVTQATAADVADVTPVTVRNTYTDLRSEE